MKRKAPAREDIEVRRDRLLDVLWVVVPALPDTALKAIAQLKDYLKRIPPVKGLK